MADESATARLRPQAGPCMLRLRIGDGVVADWTVKIRREGAVIATFHGITSDGDPPEIEVPSPAIGARVEWLVVLFGAAWMWRLSRGRGPGPLPRRLERLPSAGLLGEGTPPLSEGLTVWQCRPEDAAAAVGPLLARLARGHRVLLAASERTPIPAVAGGPVYRVHGARPRELGDLAARLAEAPGLPVTVLMLGQGRDGADLRASEAALPVGIGGVVLLAETARTALPTAFLTRTEGGWRLETDQRVLSLVERDGTFHPA